jgi:hypothetical protein
MQEREGGHMRWNPAIVMYILIISAGCTPEATAPQGGAAVGKVVPVAVPDVWCPASADSARDSTASRRTRCGAPETHRGGLRLVKDSAGTPTDTTK